MVHSAEVFLLNTCLPALPVLFPQKRSYGQLLFERVCDYVDLLERDYFGLTYRDEKDTQENTRVHIQEYHY